MRVAAIDPGKTGAVVSYDTLERIPFFHEVPYIDGAWSEEAMYNIADGWKLAGVVCVGIEVVQPFPGPQLWASCYSMEQYGMWRGVLRASGIPYKLIRSQEWKLTLGLTEPTVRRKKGEPKVEKTKAQKDAEYKARKIKAVLMAEQTMRMSFRTKRGALLDGPAEACLLGRYLERLLVEVPHVG